jgi:hypothetical protein
MGFIIPGFAGFLGTLAMTFVLRRARYLHLPETQMVRAIGSFVTRDYNNALVPGTVIHLFMGTIFAYLYAALLDTIPMEQNHPFFVVISCTFIGFVHGIVVTLFLIIAIAQYHPLEAFRKFQPEDTASHVIGHLVYGLVVGLIMGFGMNFVS